MKFETPELSLASALLALGFIPLIEKTNSRKVIFKFEKTPELDKAISDFWNNNLKLNPKQYWNCVRELKARMYAE
jgi:hypothetical protein